MKVHERRTGIPLSSTISLTSPLDGDPWITPRRGRFTPGKKTGYPLYRKLGGPRGRPGLVRKISPTPGVFFSWFLVLIVLHFVFCILLTTHNTNIHAPADIRTRYPRKRSAADHRLRPVGHWDWRGFSFFTSKPKTLLSLQQAHSKKQSKW